MKVVLVLLDSLNRRCLGPYGGTRVPTPNFDRLASRTATYEAHYVGSMPCMPARRDLLTGRLSFLHRSWGPLEPFDEAFPAVLSQAKGTYSHLVTDHHHYWEDGGATYHTKYDTYDFIRGQEGDRWKAMVQPPWERLREMYSDIQFRDDPRSFRRQDLINREFIKEEADFPSARVVAGGIDFLDRNYDADNWYLQIETFDPHEPFVAPARFKEPFDTGWDGPILDWPRYGRVEELPEECEELRANYYATVAHCDSLLGEILDRFDALGLWDDTALIVTTDHGFLLGEHDFWAKNRMNIYEEVARIPLFVHDPRTPRPGYRCAGLTQTVDLAATMYDLFECAPPDRLMSRSVLGQLHSGAGHDAVLFGYFGGAVNIADGRYTYHRYPPDIHAQDIYQYTLMPTHIHQPFHPDELKDAQMAAPSAFTGDLPVLKVPVSDRSVWYNNTGPGVLLEDETRLYDLQTDPGQAKPLMDEETEQRLAHTMTRLMRSFGAPAEAYDRINLDER
ncbi:MAG: sulfatase [Pseudomonadota bacterium]